MFQQKIIVYVIPLKILKFVIKKAFVNCLNLPSKLLQSVIVEIEFTIKKLEDL